MLRIVPHTVPRVGRSNEYFPDGFELHLLHTGGKTVGGKSLGGKSLGGKTLPKKRSKQVFSSSLLSLQVLEGP